MSDQRIRVYIWEFPVRLTHWINVLCILILSVTGIYIGHPFIHAYSADQYIMGWVRFIHFTTAYVFVMSIIIRIYWAFVGNKYANWRGIFPSTSRRWREIIDTFKYYFFISRVSPHSVGHQALAGLSYLVLYVLFISQIVCGFALYSLAHEGGFIWTLLGGWLPRIINLQYIRLFHHLNMYVLLAFLILHVYITWFYSAIEQNGLVGSMFNGYKFIRPKEVEQ